MRSSLPQRIWQPSEASERPPMRSSLPYAFALVRACGASEPGDGDAGATDTDAGARAADAAGSDGGLPLAT